MMSMSEQNPFELALERFERVAEALEMACERELIRSKHRGVLDDEVSMLLADRTRLAEDLDKAMIYSNRLASTNQSVVERLDAAMQTIHTVLSANENSRVEPSALAGE